MLKLIIEIVEPDHKTLLKTLREIVKTIEDGSMQDYSTYGSDSKSRRKFVIREVDETGRVVV